MSKSPRVLFAILMTLALCLSLAPTVFADDPDPLLIKEAAITKLLQVPYGTKIPDDMIFKFEVRPVSMNRATETSLLQTMPYGTSIDDEGRPSGSVEIDFGVEDMPGITVGGISTWYLESGSLFNANAFPHAGVYEYRIAEIPNTYPVSTTTSPVEVITWSGAVYTVKVFVTETTDDEREIYAIEAERTAADGDDGDTLGKVDPTPGGNTEGGTSGSGDDGKADITKGEYEYSQMTFTNTYYKTNVKDRDDLEKGDYTLAVSKTVNTGDAGLGSLLMPFSFALTVKAPSLVPGEPVFTAYIIEKIAEKEYVVSDEPIEFTSGTGQTFSLRHDQCLAFIDTPVGTSYEVGEAGATNYTPGVNVIYNGDGENNSEVSFTTTGETDKGLYLPGDYTESKIALYVGEGKNSADFTNTFENITPAGLDINDLPFYGLILVALVALVTFIAVRSRKRYKHYVRVSRKTTR